MGIAERLRRQKRESRARLELLDLYPFAKGNPVALTLIRTAARQLVQSRILHQRQTVLGDDSVADLLLRTETAYAATVASLGRFAPDTEVQIVPIEVSAEDIAAGLAEVDAAFAELDPRPRAPTMETVQ